MRIESGGHDIGRVKMQDSIGQMCGFCCDKNIL